VAHLRVYAAICLAGLACFAAALPASAQEATLSLRLPAEDKVAFRGIANFDGLGPAAPAPLYPAPNVVGAIAALLTHAAIIGSVDQSRQDQIRESADRVLTPYRPVLDGFTYRELMQRAAARMTVPGAKQLAEFSDKPAQGLWIETAPVFAMTQDLQAIMLDSPIVIRKPGEPADKGYQVVVRVISAPQVSDNVASYWSDDNGSALKDRSAALFAESVDTALRAMTASASPDAPHRTVRYRLGGEERMERAQVLSERCDRLLIRNLRGWLMSVPVHCEQQAVPATN
jgi:hypothetical protein